MDIIDRIQQVISHEGMKVSSFAKSIGVGDQTIRGIVVQRRNKPGYDILVRILQTYPWLNATWLITGESEMVRKESSSIPTEGVISKEWMEYLREKDRQIAQLVEEKKELEIRFRLLEEKLISMPEQDMKSS